jgi:hypothetical protein
MSATASRASSHVHKSELQEDTATIEASLDGVQKWIEDHHYRGYEPFDGLSSWARSLTFRNLMADRLLMQLIRQSPINLRPIFGVTPKESTKGRGYIAHAYLYRYKLTGESSFLEKAEACLDWLDHHKCSSFTTHSWSNHFDFASRGGSYTKNDPIIVWTALIGQAYLEAFEITGNARWLKIAESASNWVMALPREKTPTGDCISYMADRQSSIHNSNMLGAALLARTAKHTGNREYETVAQRAMEYSCTRQLPDGSWWYGEAPRYHWIDNFHTGYNLDSLLTYLENSGDIQWQSHLERGLAFFKANFFEPDGCPKYYHNRRYPIDSQCAAQAIETLALFSDRDPECSSLGLKVAQWTIANMQDSDGHFYYRIYPMMKAKTPMLHWAQATMFKGLAVLLFKQGRH